MNIVSLLRGSKGHAARSPFQQAGVRARDCTLQRNELSSERRSLVISHGKGKNRMRQGAPQSQQMRPPTPPVDPDNEEFVIFVRAMKLPRWIPFTIVKGGAQANLLVKAMNGNFGKEFYSKTLINNIAQVQRFRSFCVLLNNISALCMIYVYRAYWVIDVQHMCAASLHADWSIAATELHLRTSPSVQSQEMTHTVH